MRKNVNWVISADGKQPERKETPRGRQYDIYVQGTRESLAAIGRHSPSAEDICITLEEELAEPPDTDNRNEYTIYNMELERLIGQTLNPEQILIAKEEDDEKSMVS